MSLVWYPDYIDSNYYGKKNQCRYPVIAVEIEMVFRHMCYGIIGYFCVMIRFIRKYPLSLLIIAAIVFLSLFNPPQTKLDKVTYIDKIAHVCMYGGLELIIWLEYLRHHAGLQKVKIIMLGIIAPILLGGAMEIAQTVLTQNRSGEWMDFVADAVGVLAGAAIGYYALRNIISNKE